MYDAYTLVDFNVHKCTSLKFKKVLSGEIAIEKSMVWHLFDYWQCRVKNKTK